MKNHHLGLLVLRVSFGIMMLLHGIAKIHTGTGKIEELLIENGLPTFLAYGVIVGEVLAPILLILGYRTRIASIVLFVNCIFIIYLGPYEVLSLGKYGGWHSELPGLFLFGALTLIFTGGGNYSISTKHNWD